MPNNLTGDYEGVVQLSVQQINYMLGTMHQNKTDATAAGLPSFEHSAAIDIRESKASFLETAALTNWLNQEAQKSPFGLSSLMGQIDGHKDKWALLKTGLPAVDKEFRQALDKWRSSFLGKVVGGQIGGRSYVQLSAPWLAFDQGSTSSVTVHVNIRASYYPDAGTPALPAPIHGEVQAVYTIALSSAPSAVHAEVSKHDKDIKFTPAPGTVSASDADSLATEIRSALRKSFVVHDVPLPGDFPFSEFIALGTGPAQALALPFQPSGAPLPTGAIQSLTNEFLAGSDFAAALSKEFAQSLFNSMLDQLRASVNAQEFQVKGAGVTWATYSTSLTSLDLIWKPGEIDISGKVHAHTGALGFPDYDVDFTQALNVVLDVPSQVLSIKSVGDPVVNGSSLIVGAVSDAIKQQRDAALINASTPLQAKFSEMQTKLKDGFASFDHYIAAGFRFTETEITPDGLILRAKLGGAGRIDPIVSYKQLGDGSAFTAFESWIPGGRIDQFVWSWTEGSAWKSQVKHAADAHRFIFPTPAAVATTGRICLRIEGSRMKADGSVESVIAGQTCKPSWFEPLLEVPAWLVQILLPFWGPQPQPNEALGGAIAGHINMAGQSSSPRDLKPNYLVHFTGERFDNRLTELGDAISMSERQTGSLVMVLVFPLGTFRIPAGDFEAKLGGINERFGGRVLVTEDYVGGWTKAFSVTQANSTYLMNANRQLAWKQEGRFDGKALAKALSQHLVPAPAPKVVLMELNVRPGEPAPDVGLRTDRGQTLALHRLHGKRVALNFWQSWSAPCLRELRHLQRLQAESDTAIVAVNSGESPETIRRFGRENNLNIHLVHDPDQLITSRYGVQCWPTTVFINQGGMIDRIQFGLSENAREKGGHAAV